MRDATPLSDPLEPGPLSSPVQWYGGKGNMIEKLLPLVPPGGRPYCEPFAGGASLFFARPPAPVEVLNDLDGDLVGLFRLLQDPDRYQALAHRLRFTLYARAEFERALEYLRRDDTTPLERAWAKFVAHNMGYSGTYQSNGNWGRVFKSTYGMAGNCSNWMRKLSMLEDWHRRLLRVQIDCRDALEVIRYWDNPGAVFYLDPPYHPEARINRTVYASEPDAAFHEALVETILAARGAVVLSGYAHPVYQSLDDNGWERREYQTACYAAGRNRNSGLQGAGSALRKVPRVEVVWRNPRALELCSEFAGLLHRRGSQPEIASHAFA